MSRRGRSRTRNIGNDVDSSTSRSRSRSKGRKANKSSVQINSKSYSVSTSEYHDYQQYVYSDNVGRQYSIKQSNISSRAKNHHNARFFHKKSSSFSFGDPITSLPHYIYRVYEALLDILKITFLPIGYPHSVRKEYLEYQMFDSLQGTTLDE